jgi:hypothetical protein
MKQHTLPIYHYCMIIHGKVKIMEFNLSHPQMNTALCVGLTRTSGFARDGITGLGGLNLTSLVNRSHLTRGFFLDQ